MIFMIAILKNIKRSSFKKIIKKSIGGNIKNLLKVQIVFCYYTFFRIAMSHYHKYCDTNIFYSGCPSCQNNRKHYCYWYHTGCGAKTHICYDQLYIYCPECDTNDIIFCWEFSCGSHGYRKVSLQGIIYSLNVLATTWGTEDQIKRSLIIALSQYKNYA